MKEIFTCGDTWRKIIGSSYRISENKERKMIKKLLPRGNIGLELMKLIVLDQAIAYMRKTVTGSF